MVRMLIPNSIKADKRRLVTQRIISRSVVGHIRVNERTPSKMARDPFSVDHY